MFSDIATFRTKVDHEREHERSRGFKQQLQSDFTKTQNRTESSPKIISRSFRLTRARFHSHMVSDTGQNRNDNGWFLIQNEKNK